MTTLTFDVFINEIKDKNQVKTQLVKGTFDN